MKSYFVTYTFTGGDRDIDVIDVSRQSNIRMKLRDFVEYYNSQSRTRVLNVISLEFTNTRYIAVLIVLTCYNCVK